jgi:hypothetical protein
MIFESIVLFCLFFALIAIYAIYLHEKKSANEDLDDSIFVMKAFKRATFAASLATIIIFLTLIES